MSPTDRELLELAAKAIGITLRWPSEGGLGPRRTDDDSWNSWNPLDDDGDLLRLAVALEIRLHISGMKAIADYWVRPGMIELADEVVLIEGDACAALRLAGVRAAAEIGRSMP